MKMEILSFMRKHINIKVCQFVSTEQVLPTTFDGHSSRDVTKWIKICKENNTEAVVDISETSQLLQLCDQDFKLVQLASSRTQRISL